jgi:hypothetical protein
MATTNANTVIQGLISQGKLSDAEAHSIIQGNGGYSGEYGGGKVTNYFSGNSSANTKALEALAQRGLYTLPSAASNTVSPVNATANASGVSINEQMANQVNNPVLPSGTTLTPTTMQVQQGELLTQQAPVVVTPVAQAAQAQTATIAPVAQASTNGVVVDANGVPVVNAGNYNAVQVSGNTPQATAQQGTVSELSTIQGQLNKLYSDTEDGQVPTWAQGAMEKANDVMAARGLGKSSIAAGAITAAIQNSAINIAAPDAATYFQMDVANLNNRQQTSLANLQVRQQSLLSDQAASNAALQFNASSTQQVEQFQAELVSNIQNQNASRIQAINQFNAAEANKVAVTQAQLDQDTSKYNASQTEAHNQFYSNLKYQADAFNANMAQVIDQSNVTWRRNINTANTAAVNAANQVNVQNAFGLSSYAMNAIWQKMRDEADWVFQSSTNAQDYQYKLGQIAAQGQNAIQVNGATLDAQSQDKMFQMAGAAVTAYLSTLGGK